MLRTTDGFAGRCGVSFSGGILPFVRLQTARPHTSRIVSNATAFADDMSMPQGYNREYAIAYPIKTTGNIAATARPDIRFTASVSGIGNLDATSEAEFDFTAFGNVFGNIYATSEAELNFTGSIRATGNMAGVMDLGARPSAFDVSQAVWFGTSLDGLTMHKIVEVLVAVAAGKTDIDTSGANPIVTFRNPADTVNRVTATMTGSERTDVTIT